MDYSRNFFKMSDHPLIQKHFTYSLGDFIARKVRGGSKAVFIIGINNQGYVEKVGKANYVWLPRQDQIQKILSIDYGKFYELSCDFCNWALGMAEEFPSGEQLWLAFYMSEKHQLRWDGKQWRKKNKA